MIPNLNLINLHDSRLLTGSVFLFYRVAFGSGNGLAVVDYLQKTLLVNVSNAELYGSTDPHHRQPHSPRKTRQPSAGEQTTKRKLRLLLIIITSACCQSVFLSDKVKHTLIMSSVSLWTVMLLHPSNCRWSSLDEEPSAAILENHLIHMLQKGCWCLFFSVPYLCLFFLLFTHMSFSL